MLVSLHFRFLDRFVVGTRTEVGIDFFQAPRGFDNLLHGISIFLTEVSHCNPHSTPFYNHPFMAVAIGS